MLNFFSSDHFQADSFKLQRKLSSGVKFEHAGKRQHGHDRDAGSTTVKSENPGSIYVQQIKSSLRFGFDLSFIIYSMLYHVFTLNKFNS